MFAFCFAYAQGSKMTESRLFPKTGSGTLRADSGQPAAERR
ncbi:MAG: hypothetical protein JWR51_4396 [Devosia sp.]|nr:hypothetical protein [Devosia sp.]